MFEYRLFDEELESKDFGRYTAYGIRVYEITDSREECLISLPDVSCDKTFVETLVFLCNKEKLSPTHLFDIAEDFLP